MQDYYFSWGPCSPSLGRSYSLHRGVHSDCKFQLPLVPIYDNRNNVSYPSKHLNSFSKALLGFASFRGIVGGKTGDYLPPRQGPPDPGKGLRPLLPVPRTGFSCLSLNGWRRHYWYILIQQCILYHI